jgi:hypothetical protein
METMRHAFMLIVQLARQQSFERVASLVLLALLCTTFAALPPWH